MMMSNGEKGIVNVYDPLGPEYKVEVFVKRLQSTAKFYAEHPDEVRKLIDSGVKHIDLTADAAQASTIVALKEQLSRAERALVRGGFVDHGAAEWKPPIGKPPVFIGADYSGNYLAEIRAAALEEAAKVCENVLDTSRPNTTSAYAHFHAAAIRALASQPAAPVQPEDDLPITVSTYGSKEACEAEHARRAAPPVQQPGDVRENLSARNHVGAGLRWAEAIAAEQINNVEPIATTRPSVALTDERLNAEWLEAHRVWSASPDLGTPDRHIIFAHAILAASSGAVAVPEGWQPIATAPEDRTIDILMPSGIRWTGVYYDRICNEWRRITETGHMLTVKRDYPAHWMEVPAAPATPAQGQTK